MPTLIENIISTHSESHIVNAGDVVWMGVDYRSARDFGGPNVVKHLEANYSQDPVADAEKTFFTFDTNAPANTTGYADNQHMCRNFARHWDTRLYDVDSGIGTHLVIEKGLALPGETAVGTDSHFNILSAVGIFGQGMGDVDVAYIFHSGRTWFEVPQSIRIRIDGIPSNSATAKDIVLFLLNKVGTTLALGKSVELSGKVLEILDLSGRITFASMATEAGAIAFFLPPSQAVTEYFNDRLDAEISQPAADDDAHYAADYSFDVSDLKPQVSPPPDPNGGVEANSFNQVKADAVFVGSCTNGRWEDFRAVAEILTGSKVKKGVMLRMVPATREVYERIIEDGTMGDLVKSGAIVSHPGCGGCASGQIGMTGRGEVQLSTSNRNFRGKQGLGDTYLASPRTAAWTALRGVICNED